MKMDESRAESDLICGPESASRTSLHVHQSLASEPAPAPKVAAHEWRRLSSAINVDVASRQSPVKPLACQFISQPLTTGKRLQWAHNLQLRFSHQKSVTIRADTRSHRCRSIEREAFTTNVTSFAGASDGCASVRRGRATGVRPSSGARSEPTRSRPIAVANYLPTVDL